jgi:putative hydrolase of HD superfamily
MPDLTAGFLSSLERLKMTPRTGWISHNISLQDVESVADHTYSTSALAMLLADMEAKNGRHVNVERVLRMALLHDLAEALTFDISKAYLEYLGKRGEAIKSELEQAAWKHLVKSIHGVAMRRSYTRLQSEFNDQKTVESKIVHAADRLDILLQILEYRRKGYPETMLADLWRTTNQKLADSKLSSVRQLHNMVVRLHEGVRT